MPDCPICQTNNKPEAPEGGWIYQTDLVQAYATPSLPVPGWIMLQTTRHAEGLAGLNAAESAQIGVAIHQLADAIVAVTGRPKTYMFAMCERNPHFHMLVGSAPDTQPDEVRGGPLLGRIILMDTDLHDRATSLTVAAQIREHLDHNP